MFGISRLSAAAAAVRSSAGLGPGPESSLPPAGPMLRSLLKSSGIYALASVASPLVSFVLAPFLTHSLSRREYGALAVFSVVIALVAALTQVGLSSSFFRAYNYDYETPEDRLGVMGTVIELLLLTSLPTAILTAVYARQISGLVLGTPSFGGAVRAAAFVLLAQNLAVPGLAWLRAEDKPAPFTVLTIASLLVTLTSTIVLVGVVHGGITGALLAMGAGYAIGATYTLPRMAFRAGVPRRRDIAANLLAFGIPVVVSTAGYLVLSVSDRFLLSRLASLSQAASYTVAYSLGTLLNVLVIMPFMLAWPAAMFSIARGTDAQRTFQVLFRWFGPFLLLATFAFSPAAILILLLLFPPSYHSAAPIIPLVAASLMFYGVSIIFGVGPGVRRKNWYTTGLTMLAAAVNLGANLILIPAYGSIGAAISTLVAYVLLAFGAYAVNQMIYPVPFEIGRFGLGLGVGIVLYSAVSALARILSLSLACTLYLGALVLYGALLLVLARRESWTVRSVAPGHREEATL